MQVAAMGRHHPLLLRVLGQELDFMLGNLREKETELREAAYQWIEALPRGKMFYS